MINAYDFDETIYKGDSSVDFYFYCLKRNKKVLLQLPKQLGGFLLYKMKIIDKTKMKEKIFSYLKRIDNIEDYIADFWKSHQKNIKEWYIKQQRKTDVIISASPEFLLKPLEKEYHFEVIASKVDPKTGIFSSKNCHDYEKIRRYEENHTEKVKEFYTDSIKADKAMLEYAKEGFIVKGNEITKYETK
ncbi:MAG: haloacid dehalogenase-like hydrolase [Bacilli bacterium]|nr:haloacid dehalogenase-like hydrolase [Bacilli bacterium]